MKKELTEKQLEIKNRIKREKRDIKILKLTNVGQGLVVGLASLFLVSGSLMGITGATLYAVGQTRIDNAVNKYMASEAFQEIKATQLEDQEKLSDFVDQLEEYHKQGYLSEDKYTEIKNEISNNMNETNDYELAKNIITNDENNEFHGILKENKTLTDGGFVFGFLGILTLLSKNVIGIGGIYTEGELGFVGKATLDIISGNALDISCNNEDIKDKKSTIKNLKNQYKKEENEEDSKEEDSKEEEN